MKTLLLLILLVQVSIVATTTTVDASHHHEKYVKLWSLVGPKTQYAGPKGVDFWRK
jgi:hypothetical protein